MNFRLSWPVTLTGRPSGQVIARRLPCHSPSCGGAHNFQRKGSHMDRQRQRLFLILLSVFANSTLWAGEQAKLDRHDDPLPEGAIGRLGTTRLRHNGSVSALAFSADNS